ncbi:MAG: hypothetical protein J7619_18420 [Dyadobacter sp.]|uniref:hypothetical protein n=1 Tax=Dyadobacter sp. TaxID=1914288 RepID=UPI001B0E930F|nr:hypothetical protein [Dyadobacter sp.]MBO9614682.1 hypothetical protein [Dyadobacter sp.]
METKEEFRARVLNLMQQADRAIKETSEYLLQQGVAVDMTEWVTVKEYCRRFGIDNTETVLQWIAQGIVPKEDTAVVEEYDNVQMLRAKPYLKSVAHDV